MKHRCFILREGREGGKLSTVRDGTVKSLFGAAASLPGIIDEVYSLQRDERRPTPGFLLQAEGREAGGTPVCTCSGKSV